MKPTLITVCLYRHGERIVAFDMNAAGNMIWGGVPGVVYDQITVGPYNPDIPKPTPNWSVYT